MNSSRKGSNDSMTKSDHPLPKIKSNNKVPVLNQNHSTTLSNKQPFDFRYIRVLIKKSSDKDSQEIFLEREWVTRNNNIPHFCNVVNGVKE